MIKIILNIVFLTFTVTLWGQTNNNEGYKINSVVVDGDTMPHMSLKPVVILPPVKFDNHADYIKFKKLIKNVKAVYPYAQLAKKMFIDINRAMDSIPSKKEQKRYIKEKEDELKSKYASDLKRLSITQGHILIKMVDRELGRTSYELLKELRGSFSAVMWQSVARLFGENLKDEFDAKGEDQLLDRIIIMIENGEL